MIDCLIEMIFSGKADILRKFLQEENNKKSKGRFNYEATFVKYLEKCILNYLEEIAIKGKPYPLDWNPSSAISYPQIAAGLSHDLCDYRHSIQYQ